MHVHCVRHGESTYNAEGRIQGQSDVPLSEAGHRQGKALAAALGQLPFDAVFASPLRRAMDTARPLAAALELPIHTDPRLIEIHAGAFQDQLRAELEQRYPKELDRWHSGDPDYAFPGGETRRALMERGRAAFEAIRGSGHERVVVVSHGGLLAAALKSLLEIPARLHPFYLRNASVSQLALEDGKVRLLTFNEVEHLRD